MKKIRVIFMISLLFVVIDTDGGRRSSGKRYGIGFAQGVRPLIGEFEASNKRSIDHFTGNVGKELAIGLNQFDVIVDDVSEDFDNSITSFIEGLSDVAKDFVRELDVTATKEAYELGLQLRGWIQTALAAIMFLIVFSILYRKIKDKNNYGQLLNIILKSIFFGAVGYFVFYLIPNPSKSEYQNDIENLKLSYDNALAYYKIEEARKTGTALALGQIAPNADRFNKNYIIDKSKIYSNLISNEYKIRNYKALHSERENLTSMELQISEKGYIDYDVLALKSFELYKNAKNKEDELASYLYAYKVLLEKPNQILMKDNLVSIVSNFGTIYNSDQNEIASIIEKSEKSMVFKSLRGLKYDKKKAHEIVGKYKNEYPKIPFGHVIQFNQAQLKFKTLIDQTYISLLEFLARELNGDFELNSSIIERIHKDSIIIEKSLMEFKNSIEINENLGFVKYSESAVYMQDAIYLRLKSIINSLLEVKGLKFNKNLSNKRKLLELLSVQKTAIQDEINRIEKRAKRKLPFKKIIKINEIAFKPILTELSSKLNSILMQEQNITSSDDNYVAYYIHRNEKFELSKWKLDIISKSIPDIKVREKFIDLEMEKAKYLNNELKIFESQFIQYGNPFQDNKTTYELINGADFLLSVIIEHSIFRHSGENVSLAYNQISKNSIHTSKQIEFYDKKFKNQLNDYIY